MSDALPANLDIESPLFTVSVAARLAESATMALMLEAAEWNCKRGAISWPLLKPSIATPSQ